MEEVEDDGIDGGLANVRPTKDRTSFVVQPGRGNGSSFTISTLHISCQSNTYPGSEHRYGGIIIYSRNGKTDWYTANNTHSLRPTPKLLKIYKRHGQTSRAMYMASFTEKHLGNLAKIWK